MAATRESTPPDRATATRFISSTHVRACADYAARGAGLDLQTANDRIKRSHCAARAMSSSQGQGWKLYYWYTPGSPLGVFPGRGEYVRLMFEEAGVAYEDVCRKNNSNADVLAFMKGNKPGFPVWAPPIIQSGDFVINQTPAIMIYLGKKFGLCPTGGPEEEAHATQLLLTIHDYHFEGNMSCHPVDLHASYSTQVEEAKVTQKKFCEERMGKLVSPSLHALMFDCFFDYATPGF